MEQESRSVIDVRSWVRSERRMSARRERRRAVIATVVAAAALGTGLVLFLADPFADAPNRPPAEQAARPDARPARPTPTASVPPADIEPSTTGATTGATADVPVTGGRPERTVVPEGTTGSAAAPPPSLVPTSSLPAGVQLFPIPDAQNFGPGPITEAATANRPTGASGASAQTIEIRVPCVSPARQGCHRRPWQTSPFPSTGRTIGALIGLGAVFVARRGLQLSGDMPLPI